MEILAQALGIIGMAFNLASYQMKSQKLLITLQMFGAIFFTVHFGMIGAITGCILNVVGILRAFVYSNKDKKWASSPFWLPFFICLYVITYVLSFTVFGIEPKPLNFLIELLPVIGMIALNLGFVMKDAGKVRITALICSPSWLIYNIIKGSIGGSITEILSLISIIVGMLRLDKKRGNAGSGE